VIDIKPGPAYNDLCSDSATQLKEQAMELNLEAIKCLAIATAFNQNSWCPDTPIEEVLDIDDRFKLLINQANANLKWAGVEATVDEYDCVEALWNGTDLDEVFAEMESPE
jgi:hypothetical protein